MLHAKLTDAGAQRQARLLTGGSARADNRGAAAVGFSPALRVGVAFNDALRTSSRPARPSPARAAGACVARSLGAGHFRARLQNLLPHLDASARVASLRGAVGRVGTRGSRTRRLPDAALVAGALRRLRLREERAGVEGSEFL